MLKRIHIGKYELGLVFKNGDFRQLLKPGNHWLGLNQSVDRANLMESQFKHRDLEVLVREPELQNHLKVFRLTESERALIWVENQLQDVVGPGLHAYWKGPKTVHVEVFDADSYQFEHPKINAILAFPGIHTHLIWDTVQAHERRLLFVNGSLEKVLDPGRHVFWRTTKQLDWTTLDLRDQIVDVAGQEIMTADKVTLRINLMVVYRIVDVLKAGTRVADLGQALYREAQMALRAAVGTRTLDALLANKDAVGPEVAKALSVRVLEYGVNVLSVGVRDLILPGDMKSLFNQVTEAQKAAEANLIKRREETAAARSQANTARLMAENPHLIRMRELEAIQEILNGSKSTFIFSGTTIGNQLRDLIQLNGSES